MLPTLTAFKTRVDRKLVDTHPSLMKICGTFQFMWERAREGNLGRIWKECFWVVGSSYNNSRALLLHKGKKLYTGNLFKGFPTLTTFTLFPRSLSSSAPSSSSSLFYLKMVIQWTGRWTASYRWTTNRLKSKTSGKSPPSFRRNLFRYRIYTLNSLISTPIMPLTL